MNTGIIYMARSLITAALSLASVLLSAQDDWITFFEKSGGSRTPRYEETIEFCRRLSDASPMVHLTSFGTSAQGRELPLVIIDRDGSQDPDSIRNAGRIILMIEACIHPGESEGKDAGMMLVRDLAFGSELRAQGAEFKHPASSIQHLLNHVSILFIPLFNADGHERFGPYNRINQNGPEEMGWRVTATNLNLNRDFLKADSPEMKAWLKMFNRWMPDFFIDIHTTDGADYQYVLTYMMEIQGNMDPGLTRWCDSVFLPEWTSEMEEAGYPVFPYVQFRRWHDPKSGLIMEPAPPMLSQGYVALRNRPGLLVETHMLKPYKQRVEATYQCLVSALEILNHEHGILKTRIVQADRYVCSNDFLSRDFPLQFKVPETDSVMVYFRGVNYEPVISELTGGTWFRYSNTPETIRIPLFSKAIPSAEVRLPEAYIIPVEWTDVIDRLELHGVIMEPLKTDSSIAVTLYRLKNPRWQQNPYEGRHPLVNIEYDTFTEVKPFPAGSVIIPTTQPAARIIASILEPLGSGSYLYWGFFDAVFEQKEYFEFYVMEPMAEKMLENDPVLRKEFEAKMASDSVFASSQWLILNWFLQKTPYADKQRFVYPVGKIEN